VLPEGTRVDEPDALGSPHTGGGRLVLESGAPIFPAAVAGVHHLSLGPIPQAAPGTGRIRDADRGRGAACGEECAWRFAGVRSQAGPRS
jgi:1-acyl-sn-glycerol-3-phosphate acyltransferase